MEIRFIEEWKKKVQEKQEWWVDEVLRDKLFLEISYGLRVMSYELWVTRCELRDLGYGLLVMGWKLRVLGQTCQSFALVCILTRAQLLHKICEVIT